MVTYLDTSAWLKVYVREAEQDRVVAAIGSSQLVSTSIIAYAEARAGLAHRMREGDFTEQEYANVIGGIDADWNTFARVPILEHVARNAGEIAQQYALRGCDAVHLASALHLHQRFEDLRFLAFDNRLVNAARAAGIPVYTD